MADYFESGAKQTSYPKLLANLLISEVLRLVPQGDSFVCPISSEHLSQLATLVGDNVINNATAKKLLRELWETDSSPVKLVEERHLAQINDRELLRSYVSAAIAQNPRSAEDYRRGKRAAAGAIVGAVMAKTGGRANPALLSSLVQEELS